MINLPTVLLQKIFNKIDNKKAMKLSTVSKVFAMNASYKCWYPEIVKDIFKLFKERDALIISETYDQQIIDIETAIRSKVQYLFSTDKKEYDRYVELVDRYIYKLDTFTGKALVVFEYYEPNENDAEDEEELEALNEKIRWELFEEFKRSKFSRFTPKQYYSIAFCEDYEIIELDNILTIPPSISAVWREDKVGYFMQFVENLDEFEGLFYQCDSDRFEEMKESGKFDKKYLKFIYHEYRCRGQSVDLDELMWSNVRREKEKEDGVVYEICYEFITDAEFDSADFNYLESDAYKHSLIVN